MSEIIQEVKELNIRRCTMISLEKVLWQFLKFFFNSPSRCAVADMCAISVDRRLTDGETYLSAIDEIKNLPSVQKYKAEVTIKDMK